MAQKITNLPVGAIIKDFGSATYGSGKSTERMQWIIIDFDHAGYPANTATLMSRYVHHRLAFDARETSNPLSTNIKNYGNGVYALSNIDQWLNSTAAAGKWFAARHTYDLSPSSTSYVNANPYSSYAGFLNGFSEKELAKIVDTPIETETRTLSGTTWGALQTVTLNRRAWLLSVTECGFTYPYSTTNVRTLGKAFAYFQAHLSGDTGLHGDPLCTPAGTYSALCSNYEGTSGAHQRLRDSGSTSYYAFPEILWGRVGTEGVTDSSYIGLYETNGSLGSSDCGANQAFGIRPVLNITTDTLVSDEPDSDGCYTIICNEPPTTPGSLTLPTEILGGSTSTITWSASSDPDGNLKGYCVEVQLDGGTWKVLTSNTTAIRYHYTVPKGTNTVAFRVKATDTHGAESAYITSVARSVINNTAPSLTCSVTATDLGTYTSSTQGPTFDLELYDPDGDEITLTFELDGTVIDTSAFYSGDKIMVMPRPSGVVSLQDNEFIFTLFSGTNWIKILNGTHTLKMTVSDPRGASSSITKTFTKNVTEIDFFKIFCLDSENRPQQILCQVQGEMPIGSILTVYACNNGYDASPTWQDITNAVQTGNRIIFTNDTKTADTWGILVHVILERGTATDDQECYISAVGGNWSDGRTINNVSDDVNATILAANTLVDQINAAAALANVQSATLNDAVDSAVIPTGVLEDIDALQDMVINQYIKAGFADDDGYLLTDDPGNVLLFETSTDIEKIAAQLDARIAVLESLHKSLDTNRKVINETIKTVTTQGEYISALESYTDELEQRLYLIEGMVINRTMSVPLQDSDGYLLTDDSGNVLVYETSTNPESALAKLEARIEALENEHAINHNLYEFLVMS